MQDPTKNASVLTVEDIRKIAKQLKKLKPRCPKCGHQPHRAFCCGRALDAAGKPIGERTCECNVTFQLTRT